MNTEVTCNTGLTYRLVLCYGSPVFSRFLRWSLEAGYRVLPIYIRTLFPIPCAQMSWWLSQIWLLMNHQVELIEWFIEMINWLDNQRFRAYRQVLPPLLLMFNHQFCVSCPVIIRSQLLFVRSTLFLFQLRVLLQILSCICVCLCIFLCHWCACLKAPVCVCV